MQRLEVSGAVRLIYRSLGVRRLRLRSMIKPNDVSDKPATSINSLITRPDD
jgi:hypothetical protein